MLRKGVLKKDMLHKSMSPKGVLRKGVLKKDMLHKSVLHKDMLRKGVLNKDMLHKSMLPKGMLQKCCYIRAFLHKSTFIMNSRSCTVIPTSRHKVATGEAKSLQTNNQISVTLVIKSVYSGD